MPIFCQPSPCRGSEYGAEEGSKLWGENKQIHTKKRVKANKETEDLQETSRQCCSYLGFRKLKEASVHVDEESMKEQGGHKVCMHVDMCVHL